MLDDDRKFIRVTADDIDLAKPLRWTLYDGNRQVIREKGRVFETQAEIEAALAIGGYRLPDEAPEELGVGILRPERGSDAPKAAAKVAPRVLTIAFENSKIRIGDTLVLQSSPEAPRFPVRLIGYLRSRSVIVTPPEVNGEVVMVRDGQSFVGRFFSGQNAFAFSTSVSKQTSVPYPHIHLAYPRELRVQEVRKSPRVDVGLIAAIEFESKAGQTAGKIINISPTGAGFRAKQSCGAQGDKLLLKFKLTINGLDTVINVRSEVCTVREMTEEASMPFLHGIRFIDLEDSTQFALAAFVYGSLLGEN